jgi:hypothetical protein
MKQILHTEVVLLDIEYRAQEFIEGQKQEAIL